MNSWRSRATFGLTSFAMALIHAIATVDVSNTDLGMLIFHGSAVACELFLIYLVPHLLEDRVCTDMETLCIVSIVANALGWGLYVASAPPVFFNTFTWGLSYVQLIRLSTPDRYDADHYGVPLLRGGAGGRN
jgi:hypothetical protein